MATDEAETAPELAHLGEHLAAARLTRRWTQRQLGRAAGLPQTTVSHFESGARRPSLAQLVRLAGVLQVPLQWFLTGSARPGLEVADLALQLQGLGVVDLLVQGARVPGAFRPTEQVIAAVLGEPAPEARILEALPAVLAWNSWDSRVLLAYGRRVRWRLAWLADVTLTVHKQQGFPGGCPSRGALGTLLRLVKRPPASRDWDTLGRAVDAGKLSPVARRWKIGYPAALAAFHDRARELHGQRHRAGPLPLGPMG